MSTSTPEPRPASPSPTRHALIVDDSRSTRSTLRRIVTGLGWDTSEAADGRAALDLLEQGLVPDLCLVGWTMPVMDGREFVGQVRAEPRWRGVTLVVTTGDDGDPLRPLAAGAHACVVKPFTAETIADELALLGLTTVGVPAANP